MRDGIERLPYTTAGRLALSKHAQRHGLTYPRVDETIFHGTME